LLIPHVVTDVASHREHLLLGKELIRARTSEGREHAKARGVKLGRKPKLTDHQKREAIRRRDQDGEPVREIAHTYNVSHSTISRLTA
jgi:DNA invertase Pin-like site-specific DNA recombinase